MVRKKKENKQKTRGIKSVFELNNILSSEKTDFIVGLLLTALFVYMIISMSSFLVTGKTDQSILESLRPGEWMNSDKIFANTCRSFGAILAYNLITVNFGLPAFIIPIFILFAGLKAMGIYSVNLWKIFACFAIAMIWASIAFARFFSPFFPDLFYNLGGRHGQYCVEVLENMIGTPGLTIVLIFTALTFLIYLSAETINVIRRTLNPVKYFTSKVKLTITNYNNVNDDIVDNTNDIQQHTSEIEIVDDNEVKKSTLENHEEEEKTTTEDIPYIGINVTNKVTEEEVNAPVLNIEIGKEEEPASSETLTHLEVNNAPINPLEPFLSYKYPTLDLLKKYGGSTIQIDDNEIHSKKNRIVEVLRSFKVEVKDNINVTVGPTITLYEIIPAEGVRISSIRNLEDDIALSLSALGVRIIAPIPGKGTIGIEVPNKKSTIVSMESILNSKKFQNTDMDLPIALGKTITNEVFMVDLAKIPHLLVAGATGQGKSVGLNAILTSLLYKKHPNELKLVLIDPKKVEFGIYNPIANHFLAQIPSENDDEDPVITDVKKVVNTLNSLCTLMDRRYDLLKLAGARNIKEYNDKFLHRRLNPNNGHDYMPYIVVVIDEFGDLIMTAGKEIELPIARIAQLARAVGIHMVIATQRPTTTIITGNIKANFPGRMAFKVSASVDSKTILDRTGANQLIGRGDMLFLSGSEPVRVQCAFVDTPEVENVNNFISKQIGPISPMELPEPVTEESEGGRGKETELKSLDAKFSDAAHVVVTEQTGSTSLLQRRFEIGYNRAGKIMDQLEKAGVVGPAHGGKPREVLITDINTLNTLLAKINGSNNS